MSDALFLSRLAAACGLVMVVPLAWAARFEIHLSDDFATGPATGWNPRLDQDLQAVMSASIAIKFDAS